jgi:hypothetical protein
MQFKTFIAAAITSSAPLMAVAQSSCPEASRFGDVTVTPTTFAPGDVRSLPFIKLDSCSSLLDDLAGVLDPYRLQVLVQPWNRSQVHRLLPGRAAEQ